MRNPKRRNRILKLIKEIWKESPDLRLFQLLGNPFPPEDHYYKEDELLEKSLREYYKKRGDK